MHALMRSTRDAFRTGLPYLTSIVSGYSSITGEEFQHFQNNMAIATYILTNHKQSEDKDSVSAYF